MLRSLMASTPPTDPDGTDRLLRDAARGHQAAQIARAASGAIAEDGGPAAALHTSARVGASDVVQEAVLE